MMKVLVVYATKYGSTAEIAHKVGAAIEQAGCAAEVRPASEVTSLDGYDGVVVGSGLYGGRWHQDASAFVRRFEGALKMRPVWLFSSGPTGGSKEADAVLAKVKQAPERFPMTKSVERYAWRIGARAHATFPGVIGDNMKGFWTRWVPKGDWRDFDAIAAWGRGIAAALSREPVAA